VGATDAGEPAADAGHSAAGGALDLGSGGGLPGLVLAVADPSMRWTLLDARERSVAFLSEAVAELGLGHRVRVVLGRAEEVGRDPEHRGRYGLVVARGFGPPAVTAECAAALLEVGGHLVVSEPPGSRGERWPEEPLAALGMCWKSIVRRSAGSVAVLEQVGPAPTRFPRRTGVPAKRPLFDVSRETRRAT
jgi:16S rRNA (guanine527-N7)-methyltransferase